MEIPAATSFWVDTIVSNRSNQEIGPVSLSHERVGSALTHRSHELIPVLPFPHSIPNHSPLPIPSAGTTSLLLISATLLLIPLRRR
jgi:hypothetical protein